MGKVKKAVDPAPITTIPVEQPNPPPAPPLSKDEQNKITEAMKMPVDPPAPDPTTGELFNPGSVAPRVDINDAAKLRERTAQIPAPVQTFRNDGSPNLTSAQGQVLGERTGNINPRTGKSNINRLTGLPMGYDPRDVGARGGAPLSSNYDEQFKAITNSDLPSPDLELKKRMTDSPTTLKPGETLKPNGLVDDGINYGMSGKPQANSYPTLAGRQYSPGGIPIGGYKQPTGMEREITPSVQKQRNDATSFSTLMKDKAEAWNNMDPGMQSRVNIGLGGSGATGPSGNYVKGNLGPSGGIVTNVRPASTPAPGAPKSYPTVNSSQAGGTAPKKPSFGRGRRR